MQLSEWNRHFKKTDPSIHREKIKLIARHHASIWWNFVQRAFLLRFFFSRVHSLGWKKNSFSEMLMTITVAPSSLFFFLLHHFIRLCRRSVFEERILYSTIFRFRWFARGGDKVCAWLWSMSCVRKSVA